LDHEWRSYSREGRGIFDMYEFYQSLDEFWTKYRPGKSLNWIGMYSVYNDDAAFEKMFVKKKYESNLLFPGLKGHPTKTQVREVLQYLNTHNRTRQDRLKIAALKSILDEFSS